MRLAERAHWSARADVRTALVVGGVLSLSVIGLGAFTFAYAAMESLEEADRWFEVSLGISTHAIAEWESPEQAVDAALRLMPDPHTAIRLRRPDGTLLAERGSWPDEAHRVAAIPHGAEGDERDLLSAFLLRRQNVLVGSRTAHSGRILEIAVPLRHFASESEEQLELIATWGAIAAAVVLLIGIGAVARAFSPLRRGTRMLRDADGNTPGLRLPTRGTGDPIDRHAETLNQALERIDASFARLRSFSSNVAHELNTPLNRIINVSEVALLEGSGEELRKALETVQSSTEQLIRVVRSLLLLAEIDDRRFVLRRERIDVRCWIAQHVEVYEPSFESKGVKLVAHADPLAIEGDVTLLDRVLLNLLENALGHAPRGSTVTVSARADADGLLLWVDDAGPGVAEEDRERIFDRFERLDGDTALGHGLGLTLARSIVELHGGRLGVSANEAGGARFELRLPRTPSHG